jgi:putative addiction module component (TIGR02574 family)
MPLTLEQIVEEARHLPADQLVELVNRLTREFPAVQEVEEAWKIETRRRVAEIESGQVQGIPGDAVSDRVRRIAGR